MDWEWFRFCAEVGVLVFTFVGICLVVDWLTGEL